MKKKRLKGKVGSGQTGDYLVYLVVALILLIVGFMLVFSSLSRITGNFFGAGEEFNVTLNSVVGLVFLSFGFYFLVLANRRRRKRGQWL